MKRNWKRPLFFVFQVSKPGLMSPRPELGNEIPAEPLLMYIRSDGTTGMNKDKKGLVLILSDH